MSKDKDPSEEYISDGGTTCPLPEESTSTDYVDETKTDGHKYGLSKPQRHMIRGKIIHDKD